MPSGPIENTPRPFKHADLRVVSPAFQSGLTDLIIELDYLRRKTPTGSTPRFTFEQIKDIFHMLESIASARIEGNRTTVAEYVETKIEGERDNREDILEIRNMEAALRFIDSIIDSRPVNRALMSELHKLVVADLTKEGSESPGEYRRGEVIIRESPHVPPPHQHVERYMTELFEFINRKDEPKFDLLKTAVAHHRFVWIHPFDNGNGRSVRLLTYAMLVRQGFNVNVGRILNPAAVFCHDRNQYAAALSGADAGTDQGILEWCRYVLEGLKREIEKIDKIIDYGFLSENILLPAIDFSSERETITAAEASILRKAVERKEIVNADIQAIFPGKSVSDVSRMIGRLRDKKMLVPIGEKKRKYMVVFQNNRLMRGVIDALDKSGFLPV